MLVNDIKTALTARLAGNAALTSLLGGTAIYDGHAPQGAPTTCVIFQYQSGVPNRTLGGGPVAWENQRFLVKAVTEGASAKKAGEIAAQIDTLLDREPLTVTGHNNFSLLRVGDIDYREVSNGKTYNHVGASYRLLTQ